MFKRTFILVCDLFPFDSPTYFPLIVLDVFPPFALFVDRSCCLWVLSFTSLRGGSPSQVQFTVFQRRLTHVSYAEQDSFHIGAVSHRLPSFAI